MTDTERDAWLSEMWSYCRELPRHEREEKRLQDAIDRALMVGPQAVDSAGGNVDRGAA